MSDLLSSSELSTLFPSVVNKKRAAMKSQKQKDFEKLSLIVGGHIFFQTLSAAVQLDLFDVLSRKPRQTRAQIAKALGIEEKPARILLLGCTSLGLTKKAG